MAVGMLVGVEGGNGVAVEVGDDTMVLVAVGCRVDVADCASGVVALGAQAVTMPAMSNPVHRTAAYFLSMLISL